MSGGLFSGSLARTPIAPSTWDPRSFAQDLFLDDLIARCFRVRIGGHEAVLNRGFLLRVLSHPPTDPRVTEFRQDILAELASVPLYGRQLEKIYTTLCRLRAALEGATVGKKFDATRRQLEVLALVKDLFDQAAGSFADSTSGLTRLQAFGASVRAGEPYRSMADLLEYDDHLSTLSLTVRVGADGAIPSEGEEIFELVVASLARLRPQAFITTHFLTFAARLDRERKVVRGLERQPQDRVLGPALDAGPHRASFLAAVGPLTGDVDERMAGLSRASVSAAASVNP